MKLSDKHTIVFVGGLHRSGTTLLHRYLSHHPQISGFENTGVHEDEGQYLQTVYQNDNFHGGPGRFAFSKLAHLTERSELVSPGNADKLFIEWSGYWDLRKSFLIEKTPMNIIQSRFLQGMFEKTKFIFVTRHPVASSIALQKWSGTGIYSLINHWLIAHNILEEDLKYLKNYAVIPYEYFIKESETCLNNIFKYLGLVNLGIKERIDSNVNQSYFKKWNSEYVMIKSREKVVPPLGAVHEHKKYNLKRMLKRYIKNTLFGEDRQMSLTYYEAMDAIAVFEDAVMHHGYSLIDLDKTPLPRFYEG